jgi:molybdenum cofactor cytidylyltransferase
MTGPRAPTGDAPVARFGAVVLAAGRSTRFGGAKLLALLYGRPLLQFSLDAVAAHGTVATIVVLGHEADVAERIIGWHAERRVRNPHPEAGLASSLRIGIGEAAAVQPLVDGVFVVLADQPRITPTVLAILAAAGAEELGRAGRPIVVPVYDEDTGPNPALLLRAAWPMVDELEGDRGMGPIIAAHPELVRHVRVAGSNPDVDTPEDLRRL